MIAEILLQGEENALSGRFICDQLGIKARELTIAIERERREGQPICANCGKNPGYYLAPDIETMDNYCRRLKHREQELRTTRKACERTKRKLPNRN